MWKNDILKLTRTCFTSAQGFVESEVPRGVTFQVNLAEGTDSARGCASQRMRCPMVLVMTPKGLFLYPKIPFIFLEWHFIMVTYLKLNSWSCICFFFSQKILQNFRELFFPKFFARLCVLERYFLENFGDHFVIPELGPCRPQKVLVDYIKGGISPQENVEQFARFLMFLFQELKMFGLDELKFVVIFEASYEPHIWMAHGFFSEKLYWKIKSSPGVLTVSFFWAVNQLD